MIYLPVCNEWIFSWHNTIDAIAMSNSGDGKSHREPSRAIQSHPPSHPPRHRVASQGGLQPRRGGEVATILVLHENWTEKVAQQGCGPIGCSLPRIGEVNKKGSIFYVVIMKNV